MNELLLEYENKMAQFKTSNKRYLFEQVDLSNRLIAIKGARGVGKTTLLLQLAKYNFPSSSTLYVSLDHIYFYENNLYQLAKQFEQYGGTHLLLDEVHKYPNWSRELKLIYDNIPNLQVVFTSSSALELVRSESDLSRRMVNYHLHELSFREFLQMETKYSFSVYTLDELLQDHVRIAADMMQKLKPLPLFAKYLKIGAYPYYRESESSYQQKLMNTINLMIEVDIMAVENLRYETMVKLKKMLKAIASSVPFTPNISKLSEHTGLSRNSLIEAIKTLQKAGLVIELYKDSSGIGMLTKPEKLYLNNSNLMYVLAGEQPNIGNIRETFFVNQLKCGNTIHLSPTADFLINEKYTIEVGGKNKKRKQIAGIADALVVKDDIEIGHGNIIPLWMFGLLY
jgi:predicted AAA+ superfamily ATPase